MLGAIIGDMAGSMYEHKNIKTKEFDFLGRGSKPTDDTIMTLAVGCAVIEADKQLPDGGDNYHELLSKLAIKSMQYLGREYPKAGYGGSFRKWIKAQNPLPYCSYGNGAAMRISGIFNKSESSLARLIDKAVAVTNITHNHEESIKAVKAVVTAMYLANRDSSMEQIKSEIQAYYNLDFTLAEIRETYTFNSSCQGSVPQAFQAFFESTSFEDAIRNAISIGGDSDTIAAITGGIAEVYWGIPDDIRAKAIKLLDNRQLSMLNEWESRYN